MGIFGLLLLFLVGYLIGNFSPSYLCGRIFGKLDIREHGSGNAGATNVIRLMGWKFGIPVFILDALKGIAAAAIGFSLGGELGAATAAIGVVIGHDFPVLLGFRGGKGIAATTGIFLYFLPIPAVIGIAVFVLIVLLTRMVSLGSLVFVLGILLYSLASKQPAALIAMAGGLAVFAVFRHTENIKRIYNGNENKLTINIKQG
jgi:acyl phosphate:glycerol-3-phosphate acyltransferase